MPPPRAPYRVALLGLSSFEHSTLASSLRLATHSGPRYVHAVSMLDCDFVVADAAQALAVAGAGKAGAALFIGSHQSVAKGKSLARPINTLQVLRALDRLVLRQAAARAEVAARKLRALLVDDSELALRFLETRLQRRQLDTERAMQSGQAIELLSRHCFDIVFLDVELGAASELDGLELCQHIKRQPSAVGSAHPPQVVLVSAHHSELDRARGALAGCDAYLGKPLDEDLLDRLLVQHRV